MNNQGNAELNAVYFLNNQMEAHYLLEHGIDLLGNYFVRIHYGIKLGISKTYIFESLKEQQKKVNEIKRRRERKGSLEVAQ